MNLATLTIEMPMQYINILDKDGKVALKAYPITTLQGVLNYAYYELGLAKPDYFVYQTKVAALDDATKIGRK
jgi:hypothetical protein